MTISGEFTFSIRDENLDFFDINNRLKLEPTKIIKKGQGLNNTLGTAPYDIWLYKSKIRENDHDEFDRLEILLEELSPYSNYIKEFKEKYEDVSINCYFRSDMGQIGFEIPSNVIRNLVTLDLKLNFHILSYGEVESPQEADNNELL
ncbi:MAG: DUF4279 domain-containing protein [Bacillota bacterium]